MLPADHLAIDVRHLPADHLTIDVRHLPAQDSSIAPAGSITWAGQPIQRQINKYLPKNSKCPYVVKLGNKSIDTCQTRHTNQSVLAKTQWLPSIALPSDCQKSVNHGSAYLKQLRKFEYSNPSFSAAPASCSTSGDMQ